MFDADGRSGGRLRVVRASFDASGRAPLMLSGCEFEG
jgi:hypothetical protein